MDTIRVFISYSHDSPEHANRVWDLSERLRQDGIDCRIDQHEFSPPDGWPRWCRNQVQESKFVLVVCTETYKARYEGKAEAGKGLGAKWEGFVITQELYNAEGNNTKFIPVVFDRNDLAHIPLELQAATHYDLSSPDRYNNLYRHITNQPARQKADVGTPRTMPPLPSLQRKQGFGGPPWNVPLPPNPFFTGRESVLTDIAKALPSCGAAALSGIGGIGKSETAAHYAYLHKGEYSAVFWASAASRETLVSDFASIAALLGLPESTAKEQELVIAGVRRWLDNNAGWLLIFDNANDLALARSFVPAANKGHTLLTTQAHATGTIERVEIPMMVPKEGALFLLRRAKIIGKSAPVTDASKPEQETVEAISSELGGLPLALDQAGAYIEETGCGCPGYLALFRKRGGELLKLRGGTAGGHPDPVATTLSLSFEKVAKANPAAAEILRFCAFLSPEAIPEEIVTDGATELGPVLGPVAADPLKLNEAIGEALKYSLLRRDASARTIIMHRLVQAVLMDGMEEAMQRQWAERAVRTVNRAFPGVEFAQWYRCERRVPHAMACATLIEKWELEFQEAARLLNQTGHYLCDRARFPEAELLLQRGLAIDEKALGAEHPDFATSLNNMAGFLKTQGKYAEAEPLLQRARAIFEKALGPDHPCVATSLNNLAGLFKAQGEYAEAEPLYQRALAIREKALGPDHPEVATVLENYAGLLREMKLGAAARTLEDRAKAIRAKHAEANPKGSDS